MKSFYTHRAALAVALCCALLGGCHSAGKTTAAPDSGAGDGGDQLYGECPDDGWEIVELAPLATYGELNDVWASGPDDVYLGHTYTKNASALHFDGETWSYVNETEGGYRSISCVWGSSASDVFVATAAETVAHFDGAEWTEMRSAEHFHDVWASPDGTAFAVGAFGAIWFHDGEAWSLTAEVESHVSEIWGSGPDDVWAVGAGVYHYDGESWSEVDVGLSVHLHDIWGSGSDDVWAVGGEEENEDRTVVRFDGSEWCSWKLGDETCELHSVWAAAPDDAYVIGFVSEGDDPPICYARTFHWDGEAWSDSEGPSSNGGFPGDLSLWGSGPDDIFLAGDQNAIFRFDGSEWHETALDGIHTRGVWGAGPDDVFVVGRDGKVFHFDGASWSPMESDTTDDLVAVSGAPGGDVVAVGDWATVVRYDGSSWVEERANHCRGIHDLWGSGPHDVYALCGNDGWFLHYDGASWSDLDTGIDLWPVEGYQGLETIWGSGPDDVYVVGSVPAEPEYAGVVLHFDGEAWSEVPLGTIPELTGVWGSGPNDVWIVGGDYYGGTTCGYSIHFDGTSWSEPPGLIVTPKAVSGLGPDEVIAVGPGGGIWRFGGEEWGAMDSGVSNSLMGISAAGPKDLYAIGYNDTVLHLECGE
jgi:hypothetical protein